MDSILGDLTAYIGSTADGDQTGDYCSMEIWERRTFEDIVGNTLVISNIIYLFNILTCDFNPFEKDYKVIYSRAVNF